MLRAGVSKSKTRRKKLDLRKTYLLIIDMEEKSSMNNQRCFLALMAIN